MLTFSWCFFKIDTLEYCLSQGILWHFLWELTFRQSIQLCCVTSNNFILASIKFCRFLIITFNEKRFKRLNQLLSATSLCTEDRFCNFLETLFIFFYIHFIAEVSSLINTVIDFCSLVEVDIWFNRQKCWQKKYADFLLQPIFLS